MACRKHVLLPIFVFLLSLMLTPIGRISYSASTTIVRTDPRMIFAESGEHFTTNITVMSAVDLFSWQINITYDSSVVQAVNATLPAGHFLEGRPEGTTDLMKRIGAESIGAVCSIMGPYDGWSGSGTLVTFEFEVVGTGESPLEFSKDTGLGVILLDSDGQPTYPGPNLTVEAGFITNLDRPPIASFTYSPSKPNVNQTITFNASASYDPDGHIVRYEWDFDDNTKINETNPIATHVYTKEETYTVTLTVIDNATATQKMKDYLNTTTIPHLWYELHSTTSKDVKFLLGHDIVVLSASALPTTVTVGEDVTISTTVENQGKATETFNVTAYYGNNIAATTTVEDLDSLENKTLDFTWDTTGVTPQTYVIKVEAPLEGDEHPEDNIMQDGTVKVESPGSSFPIEYVAIGGVGAAAIAIGIFFFVRKRGTPAT